jgi:hypothetical protein
MVIDEQETYDNSVKRRLQLGEPTPDDEDADLRNSIIDNVPMNMAGPAVEVPVLKDDNARIKRSKKDGAGSPSLGSAGSFEEPVRSQ